MSPSRLFQKPIGLRWWCLFSICALFAGTARAADRPILRQVMLDEAGVVRWTDNKAEVALFGTNFGTMSGHTFYTTGLYTPDRKASIDQDFAHFARMGWDGARLALWGDWENCDRAGNLIVNEHLDLMDYAIARGRERGVYFLFTPMHTYPPGIPKEQRDALTGLAKFYPKAELGTNPEAIAAQCNFLRQILNHVNPYTGVALKDEPSILFIEPINEPIHHPEDFAGSVAYINALVDAIHSTGCTKLIFFNYTQDIRMAPALRASKVQGVTAAWYPTNLGFQHNLQGNYLRTVDEFTPLREESIAKMPRIFYEFDTAALVDPYMYPAIARAARTVGVQFMSMFMYDPLVSAQTNFNWPTHNLNLVYTPAKAVSAIIAAETMRRLPRGKSYGPYPENTRFGPFRVSYEEKLSELNADDAFMYANDTQSAPRSPAELRRIVGHGSSAVVSYEGEGSYFLDQVRPGVWRLEVFPDSVMVRDPFTRPTFEEIKWRLLDHPWPMAVRLLDLGGQFNVQAINAGNPFSTVAQDATFTVSPGVYVLSKTGRIDPGTFPARVGFIGFTEHVRPSAPNLPAEIVLEPLLPAGEGTAFDLTVKVVGPKAPKAVMLLLRATGQTDVTKISMHPDHGYRYLARVPADKVHREALDYAVEAVFDDGVTVRAPKENTFATLPVTETRAPLVLFDPATDAERWSFTRVNDFVRESQMEVLTGEHPPEKSIRVMLPLRSDPAFKDYSVSTIIVDRIASRVSEFNHAQSLSFRARGSVDHKEAWLTLVERDGTGWTVSLPLTTEWKDFSIPLRDLVAGRSLKLPHPYPEMWWDYWCEPAQNRGIQGDGVRLDRVERIQISHRQADPSATTDKNPWIELSPVRLIFQ